MDTRTSIFAVALFLFVVALGWATSEHGMCDYELIKSVLKEHTKDGAVSCFDFWFNRYQTLLGVLVALGAAGFTWQGVRNQAAAANQQRAAGLIDIVSRRLEATRNIERAMKSLARTNNQTENTFGIVLHHAISVSNHDNVIAKQKIFEDYFEGEAENFVRMTATFRRRMTTIRENLQPALLVPSIRESVEVFVADVRPIERRYNTIAVRIQNAIDTKNWDTFDAIVERVVKQYSSSTNHVDLKQHPAQIEIEAATSDLSKLLDDILLSAHIA